MKTERLLFIIAVIGIVLVYISGLVLPIMENDSALHATMAMQIAMSGDYTAIFRVHEPYLDKPHLHFWLSSLSMRVFGIHAWAYRLPALLMTVLAAYSIFRLGTLYADRKSGTWGALVFLTVQAIILSNHDVRTDAVLTGTTIFAIYQFLRFSENRQWLPLILSGIFAGLSFSTKGLYGPFVIVCAIIFIIAHRQHWHIFQPKYLLVLLLSFLAACFPVLYALHAQFGYEGIAFIFWNQSVERFQSAGFEPFCSDPLFFLHTFLWVFLPWTAVAVVAAVLGIRQWRSKSPTAISTPLTLLMTGGAIVPLFVLSFSQYKLPHYMNIAFPMIALLTGHVLSRWQQSEQRLLIKRVLIGQRILYFIALLFVSAIVIFAFPFTNILAYFFYGLLFVIAAYILFFMEGKWMSLAYGSLFIGIALNLFLNTHFYRLLIPYQAGDDIAAFVAEANLPKEHVYVLKNDIGWSTYFNSKHIYPLVAPEKISCAMQPCYIIADEDFLKSDVAKRLAVDTIFQATHFGVSRLDGAFMNRKTRDEELRPVYLLELKCD